jgi:hypothetical protein
LSPDLETVFRSAHRQLKPRTPVPEISAEFFPFAGLNHTARLREQRLLVRVSDLFCDAPREILDSLALLLLAKLYRQEVDEAHRRSYRSFILRGDIQDRARAARVSRGRTPRVANNPGLHHDLNLAFDRLNTEYFHGTLARPRLSWSSKRSRRTLGRYDAAHHAIFISRIFDSRTVPAYVLEYILFHEMLHVKHQSRSEGCRLVIHSAEFREEEQRFRCYGEAKAWLQRV